MTIEIYTDGACLGNPGRGGWAYVIINKDTDTEIFRANGSEKITTNNRMELSAVINALKKIQTEQITEYTTLSVYTDSQYVQQGISSWIIKWKKNNWKTATKQPVKNQDLWQELDALSAVLNPKWLWVRGHSGNKYNELCDTLAVSAMKPKTPR